jgi:uncharacterized DUF497 family protein
MQRNTDLNFDWDDRNREHLARHNVTPEEAEFAFLSEPFEIDAEEHPDDGVRIRYVGETAAGRILILIMTWRSDSARIITAWDAPKSTKNFYLKGKAALHAQ